MLGYDRFVVVANIARFTQALRSGLHDAQQEATVRQLLSEYRQRLDELDGAGEHGAAPHGKH